MGYFAFFLGLALPVLALLPWLWASGWLAFDARMRPNWFGAVLTVALSALIGGLAIAIGGLGKTAGATTARAAQWPVVGLFAFAILAKAVSFGTLLILDNAVAAEARAMRVEAAAIMQAALPPRTPPSSTPKRPPRSPQLRISTLPMVCSTPPRSTLRAPPSTRFSPVTRASSTRSAAPPTCRAAASRAIGRGRASTCS